MHKILTWIEKIVIWFYGALLVLIMMLCVFGASIDYYIKKTLPYHNLLYLVAGVVLSILLYLLVGRFTKCSWYGKYNRWIMLVLNILLGLGLIAVSYQYYFRTGWDAGVVIAEAGKIARMEYDNLGNWYFSRCSNNVFITVIFAWVIRVGKLLGFGNDYFYLVAFQCIGWAYVGYMIYLIGDKLCRNKAGAVWGWLLYLVLVGMSPWVVVPYTDTVGMFILATIVYLLVSKKQPVLLVVLLVSGYFVKPQILIVGIAGLILFGLDFLEVWKQSKKEFAKNLIRILIGMFLGILIVGVGKNIAHIEVDEERTLGVPHYLMLGLNERTNGVFAEDDLIFSESFITKAERDAANWQAAAERLKDMGGKRLAIHLGKKLLTVYNDGSFAWGVEGGFFQELFYTGNPRLREFLRQIYIPEGRYYSIYLNVMQTAWMGTLFLAALALLSKRKKKVVLVFALAIIGFTLFELLVEPRARHTLIYIPIWIPFACLGLENIMKLFEKRTYESTI